MLSLKRGKMDIRLVGKYNMLNNYKNIRLSNIYKYIFTLTFILAISLIVNSFYTYDIANAVSTKDQEDFKAAEKCRKYHNVIISKVSSNAPYQIIAGDISDEVKMCVKQGMCAWAKADCNKEACPPAKKAWNNMTTKEQYDHDAGKDKNHPTLLYDTKVPKSVCKKAVDTYSRLNPIINNDQAKTCVKWDGQTYVENIMSKCISPNLCTLKKDKLDCNKAKELLKNGGSSGDSSTPGGPSSSTPGSSTPGSSTSGSGGSANKVRARAEDDQKCRKGASTFGWIICPGTDAMSRAADGIASVIAHALEWSILANTNPEAKFKGSKSPQNVIVDVWQSALAVGNIALAIAALVTLYSYALNTTSVLKSYDAKKLLSRLVIVAITMNLSFYICAALADLSNIAGRGVFELINSQINSADTGWYSKLLNATSAIGEGIGVLVTSYLNANVIMLAILVMLAALAMRQIALIVLVILSPLAFACYLLPNTESWFKKWWDAFIKLLIVFPFFTAAWAGCRLVGYIVESSDMPGLDSVSKGVIAVLTTVAPPALIMPIFRMTGGLATNLAGLGQKAAHKVGADKFAQERDAARRKRFGDKFKRASIRAQNRLGSKHKFLSGAISRINGTHYAAVNQRSNTATENAVNGAVDNINQQHTANQVARARDKLSNTADADVVNMATTGRDVNGNQLSEAKHAAAVEEAGARGLINEADAEDAMLAAQQSGSRYVRNTVANSGYGQAWLMDGQARNNFVNQENEWSDINTRADVQNAVDRSLENMTSDKNAALQPWSNMSVHDRTRVADRALARGDVALVNNVKKVNKNAIKNQTMLGSSPTDVAQFNHQIACINDAAAGRTYDITNGGIY